MAATDSFHSRGRFSAVQRGVALVILALPCPCGALASLTAWRSLVELEQTADMIAVGSGASAALSGNSATFTIRLDRVVKGDATLAGTMLRVDWVIDQRVSLAGLGDARAITSAVTGVGLWFLTRGAQGWLLLPPVEEDPRFGGAFVPMPAGPIPAAYAYSDGATLSDKVASELAVAIEAANGDAADFVQIHAGLLDQLRSPVVGKLYQRMASSASPAQRALGLAGLIRQGNTGALETALGVAPSLDETSLATRILILGIRDEFRQADQGGVAALGQAAANAGAPIEFRVAAAHALASIHTTSSLPFLATLLNDPSPDLRAEAVGGFSAFATGLPIQTSACVPSLSCMQLPQSAPYLTPETIANSAMGRDTVLQNEAKYLSFWRAWWTQHRSDLGF